jgi:hypothetical protein
MLARDKAYLAGFIDGEGSIGFQRTHHGRHNPFIYPRVWVYNTHKPVLIYYQKLCGGTLQLQSASSSKKMCKKLWRLGFNLKEMTKVLKEIRPYLKIKQVQADLCLEFINTNREIKRDKNGCIKKLDKDVVQFRNSLFKKYQKAQRFGKSLYPGRTVTKW